MSVRLFVAVDLPAAVRDELATFGRAVAEADDALRSLDPEALHLTLAFLGHRDEQDIGAAAGALRALAPPGPVALEIYPARPALWLAPRRPHVLTVEISDTTLALGATQLAVASALTEAIGWQSERRAFLPHVTVARVRRGASPRRDGLPRPPRAAFRAPALTLYRSHLGRAPARYEVLERIAL